MPTSWNSRTIPTTSYNITRLGGAYLLDWEGEQILDWQGEPIITIVPGGQLPFVNYTNREIVGIIYLTDGSGNRLTDSSGRLLYSEKGTQYTVRTPI